MNKLILIDLLVWGSWASQRYVLERVASVQIQKYKNICYTLTINSYIPLAFFMVSIAAFISWNFFSAALRTSSPRLATRSG